MVAQLSHPRNLFMTHDQDPPGRLNFESSNTAVVASEEKSEVNLLEHSLLRWPSEWLDVNAGPLAMGHGAQSDLIVTRGVAHRWIRGDHLLDMHRCRECICEE